MGTLFSKSHHSGKKRPRQPDITEEDKAVLSLKSQRRKLGAERKRIEALIDKNVEVARGLIAQKKKDLALLVMKKKKMQEEQVKKLDAWLLNVESMLANIGLARQQNQLFAALKQGNEAMQLIRQEVTVEDVEKLMEDTAEAKEYQERLQEALGQGMDAELEDEALEEYKVLELEVLPAAPKAPAEPLPSVPKTVPAVQVQEPAKEAAQTEEATMVPA